MAVSISTLKTAIKAAFNAEKDKTDDQAGSIDRIAGAIAEAVAEQIVQGINTATVMPALAAPNGPVTGSITITASAS
jgi:tRNA A37 threonylcarbamoyltransferase TsaD